MIRDVKGWEWWKSESLYTFGRLRTDHLVTCPNETQHLSPLISLQLQTMITITTTSSPQQINMRRLSSSPPPFQCVKTWTTNRGLKMLPTTNLGEFFLYYYYNFVTNLYTTLMPVPATAAFPPPSTTTSANESYWLVGGFSLNYASTNES